jgi:transposase
MTRADRKEMAIRRVEAFKAGAPIARGSQSAMALRLGVSRTTISRWTRSYRLEGVKGLRQRYGAGRPRRVDSKALEEMLRTHGPWKGGGIGPRLVGAINAVFGVIYDQDHAIRKCRKLTPDLFPPIKHHKPKAAIA